EYIEIELTETTTDVGFRDLKVLVNGLQSLGISTAVDDFGVGYSSLNLIRDIPWNVIKLDKSFLPDINDAKEEEKAIMLKYVIAMAQSLGLECIVEGVETEEHVEMLKENCCYLAQGFYFDKPLPKDVFEKKL
ncbi:MAG: EAL domain-containing protein, partial [Lachnospiraceae bacterium]|nr:EAL domain-containing protein [Lachnospiraceae bacterium]